MLQPMPPYGSLSSASFDLLHFLLFVGTAIAGFRLNSAVTVTVSSLLSIYYFGLAVIHLTHWIHLTH